MHGDATVAHFHDTGAHTAGCLHVQIIWPKINYLSSSIKLSPWYLQGSKALAAIETAAGNASEQVAVSDAASFGANATLDGPSAMLRAFAADSATSTEAIATTVSSSFLSGSHQLFCKLGMQYDTSQ